MLRERFGSPAPAEPRAAGGSPNTPPTTLRSEADAASSRRHVFGYTCMSVGLLYCGFGWQRCAVRANSAAHGTFHDVPRRTQLRAGAPAVPSPGLHGLEGIAAQLRPTNERNYRSQQRKAAVASKTPNDGTRNIWDLFEAMWQCGSKQRIGKIGDGGKWICQPELLGSTKPCVVYSLGSAGEPSFELEMLELGCEVHTYDPNLSQGTQSKLANIRNLHFHPVGLASADTPAGRSPPESAARGQFMPAEAASTSSSFASLSSLMEANGHRWLDVLKIDIEASEVRVDAIARSFRHHTRISPSSTSPQPASHPATPPPRHPATPLRSASGTFSIKICSVPRYCEQTKW